MAISRVERWGWPSLGLLKGLYRLTRLTPNDFFKPLAIPARGKREE